MKEARIMPDMKCFERIAVLETNLNDIKGDFDIHEEHQEAQSIKMNDLLMQLVAEQSNMKGFWSGMVFAFSAVFAAAGIAVGILANKIFGGA